MLNEGAEAGGFLVLLAIQADDGAGGDGGQREGDVSGNGREERVPICGKPVHGGATCQEVLLLYVRL